jgi:hypothetical protein
MDSGFAVYFLGPPAFLSLMMGVRDGFQIIHFFIKGGKNV